MTRIKTMGKKEKKGAAENKRQVKTGVILSGRLPHNQPSGNQNTRIKI